MFLFFLIFFFFFEVHIFEISVQFIKALVKDHPQEKELGGRWSLTKDFKSDNVWPNTNYTSKEITEDGSLQGWPPKEIQLYLQKLALNVVADVLNSDSTSLLPLVFALSRIVHLH